MYINKMIFMEYNEFDLEEHEDLFNTLVQHTDYGTMEITADHVQGILEEAQDVDAYGRTQEEVREGLKDLLGEEVLNMLLNEELDFCLVV